MTSTWLNFWNGPHRIYVNDRHKSAHYARVAADLGALVPSSAATVLDWGCGEALFADRVAARCSTLILCDAAPAVRSGLTARFEGTPRIVVAAPEELAAWQGRVDLMTVVSVVQYLDAAELDGLLAAARRLLAPQGELVIGDVIPPDAGAAADIAALLTTGARHGFLGAALSGLAATAASPYRRLRSEIGLARYDEATFRARLEGAGFVAERIRPNLGFNQRRMAFRARRRDGAEMR